MAGRAGLKKGVEEVYDSRVTHFGKDRFSYISGINGDIVSNYVKYNQVNVPFASGKVYYFNYLSNKIIDLSKEASGFKIGRCLYAEPNGNQVKFLGSKTSKSTPSCSLEAALGTNLASYFSHTYL